MRSVATGSSPPCRTCATSSRARPAGGPLGPPGSSSSVRALRFSGARQLELPEGRSVLDSAAERDAGAAERPRRRVVIGRREDPLGQRAAGQLRQREGAVDVELQLPFERLAHRGMVGRRAFTCVTVRAQGIGEVRRRPARPAAGFGSSRSSASTRISATQRFRDQLWSAGTTYHGACSVDVSRIASSYACWKSSHFARSSRSPSRNFQRFSGSSTPLLKPLPLLVARLVEEHLHDRRAFVGEQPLERDDVRGSASTRRARRRACGRARRRRPRSASG